MYNFAKVGLLAGIAALIVGCGGDGDGITNTPNPRVRFANVMPGIASAKAQVGPDIISSDIPFGTVSDYAITPNGTKDLTVGDSTFNNLATLSNQLFELDKRYTGIGFGTAPRTILLLNENEDIAPSDTVAVKFVHADQSLGNVDVYVYVDGTSLPASPTYTNVPAGSITVDHSDLPVTTDPANVRITVFATGTTTNALYNAVKVIPRRDRVALVFYETAGGSEILVLKQNL